MSVSDRQIFQAFKLQGLRVHNNALKAVASVLNREPDPAAAMAAIMGELKNRIERQQLASAYIDLDTISSVVAELSKDEQDLADEAIQVFDAFRLPRLVYSSARSAFRLEAAPERRQLHADADMRVRLFAERYATLLQRVKRHTSFAASRVARKADMQLTPVEALLGSSGSHQVLGLLTQVEEGAYALEDNSALVPVDLSGATVMGGLYTENCVLLAQGEMDNGVFVCSLVGMPPPETRADTMRLLGGLDTFGTGLSPQQQEQRRQLEAASEDAMFVMVSDCHLDRPDVLAKLRVLLEGFDQADPPPPLMVLAGNFLAEPMGHGGASAADLRKGFAALAEIIEGCANLMASTRVVLVPGPHDPGYGNALPRGPLPQTFVSEFVRRVPQAELATNPCRLRFHTQEIVFFRDDILNRMRRHCVVTPVDSDGQDASTDITAQLVRTLLDQGHLCPLPLAVQPVYWAYDAALRLYPVPDVLILADTADQYQWTYEECSAINPGSFPQQFSFVVYRPATRETEFSRID